MESLTNSSSRFALTPPSFACSVDKRGVVAVLTMVGERGH
jgi:hypothetical protein